MISARVPSSDTDQGGEPPPARHPASKQPRRGSGHAQEQLWQDLAGPLSSAAMRLRSVRSQHAGGTRESRELDEIIREVDAAFARVMRGPSPPPSGDGADPPRRNSPAASVLGAVSEVTASSAASVGEAREVFDQWVLAGCRQRLPSGATSAATDALLGQVSDEFRLMPTRTRAALGQDPRCELREGLVAAGVGTPRPGGSPLPLLPRCPLLLDRRRSRRATRPTPAQQLRPTPRPVRIATRWSPHEPDPPPPELEVASLRDDLVSEASITLREALARLEARRQSAPASKSVVGYDTSALVSTALELLQRAEDVDHETRR